jgi:hypothetical protein
MLPINVKDVQKVNGVLRLVLLKNPRVSIAVLVHMVWLMVVLLLKRHAKNVAEEDSWVKLVLPDMKVV